MDHSFGSRGSAGNRDREERSRDAFTRDLDLPRGHDRELVRERDRIYEVDGDDRHAPAAIGALRVVAECDLYDIRDDSESSRRSLKHPENDGLIRTSPLSADDRAVTLTDPAARTSLQEIARLLRDLATEHLVSILGDDPYQVAIDV